MWGAAMLGLSRSCGEGGGAGLDVWCRKQSEPTNDNKYTQNGAMMCIFTSHFTIHGQICPFPRGWWSGCVNIYNIYCCSGREGIRESIKKEV